MGDPAVFGPTQRHGTLLAVARHLVSVVAVGMFLLIGMGSAGAVELLDDVTEVLPVEEVTQTLPVDEVVEVLPLPNPEPEAQTDPPVADTGPRSDEGVAPVAVVDDVASSLDPVVANLRDPVATSVPEAPQAVNDPAPSGSDSQTPPDTLGAVQSVVESVSTEELAPPLDITPRLDGVGNALGSYRDAPALETLLPLPGVIDSANQLVDSALGDLIEPVGSLIAPSLSVLDEILVSASDLVNDTVTGLVDTVDGLVPGLPLPGSSPPIVTPIDLTPGQKPPLVPDATDEDRTGSGIPPPTQVRGNESITTTKPARPEGTSAHSGAAASSAPSEATEAARSAGLLPNSVSERSEATRSRPYDPGAGDWVKSSGLTRSALSTSTSGHVFGFIAVLALLGLAVPRLSCWLRLQPVRWRPNALALAIERPG